MQVTVLGSGTCVSDLPNVPSRYPSGFWVTWSGGQLLLEVSEGIRYRLEQIGVRYATVKHLAISHAHVDHYALPHFLQAMYCHAVFGRTELDELHLYAPDSIIAGWPALFKAFLPEFPQPEHHRPEGSYRVPRLVWHPMSGSRSVAIGNATLYAGNVHHGFGQCEALAFRLETPEGAVAYSGDTGDCPGVRQIAARADLFLCESSAPIGSRDDKGYGHLTPNMAGTIAQAAGVKRLVITHYTGVDADEAMVGDCRKAGYQGEIQIAKDFQVIEI